MSGAGPVEKLYSCVSFKYAEKYKIIKRCEGIYCNRVARLWLLKSEDAADRELEACWHKENVEGKIDETVYLSYYCVANYVRRCYDPWTKAEEW